MEAMQRRRPLLLLALILFPLLVKAQSYQVRLHGVDVTAEKLGQLLKMPASFPGQTAAVTFLQSITPALQEQGYLTASVDSISPVSGAYEAYVFLGLPYRW